MYYGDPPKCDNCGKFFSPAMGGSWVCVPACDIPGESGDERERCGVCTNEVGPVKPTSGKYVEELVCGTYPR